LLHVGARAIGQTRWTRVALPALFPWDSHSAVTMAHHVVYPIPSRELGVNSNLKQNPGY
jgi:hypothetical protein